MECVAAAANNNGIIESGKNLALGVFFKLPGLRSLNPTLLGLLRRMPEPRSPLLVLAVMAHDFAAVVSPAHLAKK
jgi:hypothetical protein